MPQEGYLPAAAFTALLVGVLVMPGRANRLRAAAGLPAFLLGVASLPFLQDLHGPDPTIWISTALLLLGPAALLVESWRSRDTLRARPIVMVLALAAAAAGVIPAVPLLHTGGFLPAFLTTGALALAAVFLWLAAGALGLGRVVRALDAQIPAPARGTTYGTRTLVVGAIVAGLAALRWPLWVLLWQPIGIGLGAGVAWWAAATRRPSLALAGASFASAFLPPGLGNLPWVAFGVAALAVDRRRRLGALIAAVWGYATIGPLLDAEVVWTVLLAGAGSALVAGLAEEEPIGVA